MATIRDGTIRVYTFRAGLLGRIGHDLRLTLERFEIEYGDGEVRATFWPASLRVDGAMVDGRLDEDELSDADRRKIRGNIRQDVLETDDHPTASFSGTYEAGSGQEVWQIEGNLTLRGETAALRTDLTKQGSRYRARIELTPTRWGIQPYKALMGALTLEDRVVVELDVPVGG